MNNERWVPKHIFNLEDVLQNKALDGLKVGTVAEEIEKLLGIPESPMAKLNRKSKIWVLLYGNVSILISDQKVICISISFHGNRMQMVQAGKMGNWKVAEWQEYANKNRWNLEQYYDAFILQSEHIQISLTSDWIINEISFT